VRVERVGGFLQSRIDYALRNRAFALPRNWRKAVKILYRKVTKSGIFISADEMHACSLFPEGVLGLALRRFSPKSVLDVGCGTGRAMEFFLSSGVDTIGVEGSTLARERSRHSDRIILHDLRKPLALDRKFDLVWCYEVAEHIHPDFSDTFMDSLSNHGDVLVLSAAPPGQGGEGHFNEQPGSYWIEKAAARGLHLDADASTALAATNDPYAGNVLVFSRKTS
jgi:SAM-dependent methyltransferase